MKWLAYAFALAILSVWQVSCWSSPLYLAYAISWPVTLTACLLLEAALFAARRGTSLDEEGRMNRRVGLALCPLALLVPAVPFWALALALLLAIGLFRGCRTGLPRHVAPSLLGATAIVGAIVLAPWYEGLELDALLGWSAALAGLFLFAYEIWLLRRSRSIGTNSGSSPSPR
jgi:hypothetical protein